MSGRHYLLTPAPLTVPTSPYIRRGRKNTIWRVGMVMLQHCVDGIEADCRVLPRRVSLVSRCHTLLPVNLYCATPPQVGQPDRGGDELTKAGNARGIAGEPLPDDAGDPGEDAAAYFLHHQQLFCPGSSLVETIRCRWLGGGRHSNANSRCEQPPRLPLGSVPLHCPPEIFHN